MKILLLILTSLLFFSFTFFDKTPRHIVLSDQITSKFVKDMKKKGFRQSMYGGSFINNIQSVHLCFETDRCLSVNECRQLGIEMVEDLLNRYNTNEEIRPYLNNYPFTEKNLEISIMLPQRKCGRPDLYLRWIEVQNGFFNVTYEGTKNALQELSDKSLPYFGKFNLSCERLGETSRVYLIYKGGDYFETYDEAYEIVYGHKREAAM